VRWTEVPASSRRFSSRRNGGFVDRAWILALPEDGGTLCLRYRTYHEGRAALFVERLVARLAASIRLE